MKRKNLVLLLVTLCTLSLLGVGFAAWVISAPAVENIEGNIEVDTVTDERLAIEVYVDTNFDSIAFGGPNPIGGIAEKPNNYYGPEGEVTKINDWLSHEGNAAIAENLKVTYSFTVTKQSGEEFTSVNDITVDAVFTEAEKGETAYGKALTAKCFSLVKDGEVGTKQFPVDTKGDSDSSNDEEIKTKIVFEVTIEYEWGEIFGGYNPFFFYNGIKNATTSVELIPAKGVNDLCGDPVDTISAEEATWGDHAAYYLGLLEAINNSAQFGLEVTVNYAE